MKILFNFLNRFTCRQQAVLAALSGLLAGLLIFIIYISRAHSYLSDDPRACINCHIMAPQYANWIHSAHRETAVCNDCHVPHQTIFHHYLFKAMDGTRHSYVYTFRLEPQTITMHAMGRKTVQDNCMRCHETLLSRTAMGHQPKDQQRLCWECHRHTPHGRVKSLSSTPNARVPTTGPVKPEWLPGLVKNKTNDEIDHK